MNDMHWNADVPANHMACTVSNIELINCDMPTIPAQLLFVCITPQCDDTTRTSQLSRLAIIATFSAGICSIVAQWDDIVKSCLRLFSHFEGGDVIP